ncbi:sensor histidine kinase [Paenibacillus sp. GXUN7292]|uniref:sensor histidine kinase n=1 Tax=Paenibacillus sp. GXUN7292 TaxID=3422499 RepID=UPI003D7CE585
MKRFKMKVPEMSIYTKLVLAFLIVLAPLFTLSLSMNYSGSINVRKEISNSMLSRVEYYLSSLETEFERINGIKMEYLEDEDLGKLSIASAAMSDIEKIQAVIRVTNRLKLLQTSSAYIEQASAHIPDIDRSISISSTSREYYDRMLQDEYKGLLAAKKNELSPLVHWEDKLFLMVSSPYPDSVFTEKTKMNFMISIELSKARIVESLLKFVGSGQGGAFLISDDGSWHVSSGQEVMIDPFTKMYTKQKGEAAAYDAVDSLTVGGETYLSTARISEKFGVVLITYAPEREILGPIKQYNLWYWALTISSLFVIIIFSSFIYRMIHRPLKSLLFAFKQVEIGNLRVHLKYNFSNEFNYLYVRFNDMVNHLNVLVHEVYEQKYRARSSELKQLQSQINPHFLYNSFFIIYRMAKIQDYDNVTRFTRYLGEYFQYITRDHNENVNLQTEIKMTRTYGEIQALRFSNRITVHIEEVPDSCEHLIIPRLTLQPIVENAFNHGLEDKLADGQIIVSFTMFEEYLQIIVEDNGDDLTNQAITDINQMLRTNDADAATTGMINVHRRLQIKYGEQWGLQCMRSRLGGFQVNIRIPLKGGEDHVASFDCG